VAERLSAPRGIHDHWTWTAPTAFCAVSVSSNHLPSSRTQRRRQSRMSRPSARSGFRALYVPVCVRPATATAYVTRRPLAAHVSDAIPEAAKWP